ncbi:MAG: hypothetical protein WBN70_16680 [Polyangiales bacterium]|jgi:hypothetical protein
MIRWWFGDYMRTTEHYKRWHPRDHVWMSWNHKQPGTHIGAQHLVHEYIGSRLFGTSSISKNQSGAISCPGPSAERSKLAAKTPVSGPQ